MIFYFSGVGNSAWVAQSLAQRLNDTTFAITKYNDEEYIIKPANQLVSFSLYILGLHQK